MYAPFFGLSKEPFSIAPDPHFLYMSGQHREALAHLLYGLGGGGGFVLLTGEIGAGKTTVCRCFLEQVPPHCTVAYVFNPKLTAVELLQTVCGEFGIAPPADAGSVKAHVDALNAFLLDAHARGRQAVLVIDEAQSLSADVLEQLRLLTNLETAERKLLQIVLIGQPELRLMLARPDLEQLAQRVIARYHLGALSFAETQQYIRHRLQVAGPNAPLPFDDAALKRLHALSGGVPRRINLVADRALLGAYAQGLSRADRKTMEQAAREVFGTEPAAPRRGAAVAALAVAGVAAVAAAAWWAGQRSATMPAVAARASGPAASAAERSASGGVQLAASAAARAGGTHGDAGALVAGASASGSVGGSAGASGGSHVAAPIDGLAAPTAPTAGSAAPAGAPGIEVATDATALLAAAHADPAIAWRELALRWNVAVGEGDPCAAVVQARLACFRSAAGGLAVVRQLARPVLVTLRGAPAGQSVHAVLVALDDRNVAFQMNGRRHALTLPALAGVWRGEFATLWRTPPGWAEGEPGRETRDWIDRQLAAAGHPGAGGASLRERVWAFQLAQGLPPDGRAGPMTLMRLSQLAGIDEPRLER